MVLNTDAYRILDAQSCNDMLTEVFDGHLSGTVSFSDAGRRFKFIPFLRFEEQHLPAHRHDYLELVFIIEGSAVHTVGKRSYRVKAGDIFFLDNTVPHSFKRNAREHLTYVNFSFLPEFLECTVTLSKLAGGLHFFLIEPFFREDDAFARKLTLDGSALERLTHLAFLIIDTFNRSYPKPDSAIAPLFRSFIMLVHNEYGRAIAASPGYFRRREALYREILAHIDKRLFAGFSIGELAGATGAGRTKLSKLFREKQGETIVEYANRRRVEAAAELLAQSDMSVIDIAAETGFNDLSNFNRIFKRIMRVTPQHYRKRTQKS
ncbi:MAG: AraC family transcriptional regulator [Spirochaetes bacterium]|nr:AraC family transcriptional regulator [Spirochaetota bacterium]